MSSWHFVSGLRRLFDIIIYPLPFANLPRTSLRLDAEDAWCDDRTQSNSDVDISVRRLRLDTKMCGNGTLKTEVGGVEGTRWCIRTRTP